MFLFQFRGILRGEVWQCGVWHCRARCGEVWQGVARPGSAGIPFSIFKKLRRGMVWHRLDGRG
jgi:hypothetical protein